MLEVQDLRVAYGAVQALQGVTLGATAGRITAVLGANGAGKSSLLRAISGIAPVAGGRILLDGRDITALPAPARARLGLAHAMEGRRLFRQLSVEENLRLAWNFGSRNVPLDQAMAEVQQRFPILGERARTPAGLLSGGQQQMLILSCATIRGPRYLLLDEPSLGLAPIIVRQIYAFITDYTRHSRTTVVIAEQMATLALKVSDRAYVLRRGRLVLEGSSADLLAGGPEGTLVANYL
ncbi:ABC transporter ATP-binding protein [Caldovatus sediminis]|uniref:ABC transporter ATP-binding protein n=1 Tax=Caldovatus sediminis TaxID=2041189 RepID=A0A8J3ECQ6_9PROT|nr:ABC transporter ATP-binding protein [Caldovatus sediminis]GGG24077.1 ABC transporter ATP-binding protein [Caldovatus sediminis]